MEMLQAGVDRSMISIWLGHESIETTQIYLDANLAIKDEILRKQTHLKALRFDTDPATDCLTSSQVCEEAPNYAALTTAL